MRDYKREELNESKSGREDIRRRLGDRGRRALQGLEVGGMTDKKGASTYLEAAKRGAAEYPESRIKAQGRAGECAALRAIEKKEGTAVDLNDTPAANAAIYDVAGPNILASVKVRGLEDGTRLRDTTLRQYQKDLAEAIGEGSSPIEPQVLGETEARFGLRKFNRAARELYERASVSGDHRLPKELGQGLHETADYMRKKATLMIPKDHAEQLHKYLENKLLRGDAVTRATCASNLGLDIGKAKYSEDVKKLLNRIEPLPLNADEIRNAIENQESEFLNR